MTTSTTSSRQILIAEIEFTLTAPAAIGAPEREEGNVARLRPVARDGWDEPWIPPSSLAGSFRDHLPAELAPRLMGDAPETEAGRPSPVRFLGTDLELPRSTDPGPPNGSGPGLGDASAATPSDGSAAPPTDDAAPQPPEASELLEVSAVSEPPEPSDLPLPRRARTAIDPRRGAAHTSTLRHTEYLPPGTRIRCWLRVDGAAYHRPVEEALATWNPVIGGGRTAGYGTVEAVAARRAVIDLDTPEGRRIWLTSGGRELLDRAPSTPLPLVEPAPLEALFPPLRWQIVDPLRVGAEPAAPGEIAEVLRDHEGRPCVPGTTWKGLLRSRAGYVLRSLGLPACLGLADAGGGTSESTESTESTESSGTGGLPGTCGNCDLCTAFGWSGDDAHGARGLLRFSDSPLVDAPVSLRQHVAIDRITGGAADGLLYTEEVVERGACVLTVEMYGPIPTLVGAALSLALWDLHCGLIGVGGGVTRGHGTLRCLDADRLTALRDDARRVLADACSAPARSAPVESAAHV